MNRHAIKLIDEIMKELKMLRGMLDD